MKKNLSFGLVIATVALGVVDTFNTTEDFKQSEVLDLEAHELITPMLIHKAPF